MLPTPDFSMMYNVITLTCTVVAMFYGQVLPPLIIGNKKLSRIFFFVGIESDGAAAG